MGKGDDMKFRVHMYEEVRRTWEVEAESAEAAAEMVVRDPTHIPPKSSVETGDFTEEVIVDPLLSSGLLGEGVRRFNAISEGWA